jgi:hypothetical protein
MQEKIGKNRLRIKSTICILLILVCAESGNCQDTVDFDNAFKNHIHISSSLNAYNFKIQKPHSYYLLGSFQFSYTRRLTPGFALKTEYDRNYGSYKISGLHLVNYHLISLQATYQLTNPVCVPDPINFTVGGGITYRNGSEWLFWNNDFAHTFRRNRLGITSSFTPMWNWKNWVCLGLGFKLTYFPTPENVSLHTEEGVVEIQQTSWIFHTVPFVQFSF